MYLGHNILAVTTVRRREAMDERAVKTVSWWRGRYGGWMLRSECFLFPTTEFGLGEVEHEVAKVDVLWWLDYLGARLPLFWRELVCRYGSKRSKGGRGREGVLPMR